METDSTLIRIQECITNRLDIAAIGERRVAAVIGDAPSHYSKSPQLWNAAFHMLGIKAIYLPLDVQRNRLKDLIAALRNSERVLGANVTVPHKLKMIDYLDELDPDAARIQAVNTIVRTQDGRLVGYNTDGEGFIDAILKPQPGQQTTFIESLANIDVLLLGAGGSARAVACHTAQLLSGGELLICNRTVERAKALAAKIRAGGWPARGVAEAEVSTWAPRVGLIINSTTKGQAGLRSPENETVINGEPYSALAPAQPIAVAVGKTNSGDIAGKASQADIQKNHEASMNLAASIPKNVRFYDLIYFPEETVFLRHGRLTGHPTMNGQSMIINQAVIAFCKRVCRAELQARGIDNPETHQRILETMYQAW
jgi:shikimate dehydrogenase